MNKQRTAMQELIDELEYIKKNNCKSLQEVIFFDGVLSIIEGKYLQKERQQIIDARKDGIIDEHRHIEHQCSSEDYYNKLYGNDSHKTKQ